MNDQPTQVPEEELSETESSSSTPSEPAADKKGLGTTSMLFDVLEMFAWSLVAVFLVFTFATRLCRVDGQSMENTLYHGELLLLNSINYTPEQDDIIVFHMTDPTVNLEKTLVKRVIATGGQQLYIDFKTGEILVDNVPYADSHSVLKDLDDTEIGIYTLHSYHHYDPDTGILSLTVPDGKLFVLGDNRNFSKDSRSLDIGFVDERCVLGKVILRLHPFTILT